jgi:hypothetical protein
MLISTDDGAGEIVASGEDTRFYDDIRCLAADWASHRGTPTAFVHMSDGTWREVQDASYTRSAFARTPMGSGLAAFATVAQARAADGSGRSLTWDEVVQSERGRP